MHSFIQSRIASCYQQKSSDHSHAVWEGGVSDNSSLQGVMTNDDHPTTIIA